jgi:hypothetical protein
MSTVPAAFASTKGGNGFVNEVSSLVLSQYKRQRICECVAFVSSQYKTRHTNPLPYTHTHTHTCNETIGMRTHDVIFERLAIIGLPAKTDETKDQSETKRNEEPTRNNEYRNRSSRERERDRQTKTPDPEYKYRERTKS